MKIIKRFIVWLQLKKFWRWIRRDQDFESVILKINQIQLRQDRIFNTIDSVCGLIKKFEEEQIIKNNKFEKRMNEFDELLKKFRYDYWILYNSKIKK